MKRLFNILMSAFVSLPILAECDTEWNQGEGTFYGGVAGTDGGNCRIFVEEGDYKHCAMNETDYALSYACGACVHVVGPKGEINMKIVDRCPECKKGDIDMTPDAFVEIANKEDGRVPIKWYYIACPDAESIKVQFVPSMNQWYFDLAIIGHRYDISSLESLNANGEWIPIKRSMDNHWQVITGDIPQPPYTLRLKSNMTDEVLVLENIPLVAGGEFDTKMQFALVECGESELHSIINNSEDFSSPYLIYSLTGKIIGKYDYIPELKDRIFIVKSLKSGRAVKVVR